MLAQIREIEEDLLYPRFELTGKSLGTYNRLPRRSTPGSAGYDFYMPENAVALPRTTTLIPTGVKCHMPKDVFLMLTGRSSVNSDLSVQIPMNIIDSDYYNNKENNGEIFVMVKNFSEEPYEIKAGTRLVQGVFSQYLKTSDDRPLKESRTGGVGSTGSGLDD